MGLRRRTARKVAGLAPTPVVDDGLDTPATTGKAVPVRDEAPARRTKPAPAGATPVIPDGQPLVFRRMLPDGREEAIVTADIDVAGRDMRGYPWAILTLDGKTIAMSESMYNAVQKGEMDL